MSVPRPAPIDLPRPGRRPLMVAAGIYAVLPLLLQLAPLTRELHYEFAALIALAASLIAAIVPIWEAPPATIGVTHSRAWELTGRSVALSLVPLLVALPFLLLRPFCGMGDGLLWFLLLVPPAAFVASSIALLVLHLARRRWLRLLLYLLIWSLPLLRALYEGLAGPHIYAYLWQVGYFPGGSWSAELPIEPPLLVARLVHLVTAAALIPLTIQLARVARSKEPLRIGWTPWLACVASIAGLVLFQSSRAELGLTRTDAWVARGLGTIIPTRHATLILDEARTDSLTRWLAAELTDFDLEEHAAALGVEPEMFGQPRVYLYADAEQARQMIGSGSTQYSKPWKREVHLQNGAIGSTLRHELAHVAFAPWGNPLGISTAQGLLEGSAVALENDGRGRTIDQLARIAIDAGLARPIEEILSVTGFSGGQPALSYLLAGSFSRWLIRTYGIRRYLALYPWGDFDTYPIPLDSLAAGWRRMLDSLPHATEEEIVVARYRFGGAPFFLQRCARRIGTLNAQGFTLLARERPKEALASFRASLDEGANASARSGLLRSLSALGRHAELVDSLDRYMADTPSTSLLPFLIEKGDAAWLAGNHPQARRLYDSLVDLDLTPATTMRASLRRHFLGAGDSVRSIMRDYFTRPMSRLHRVIVLERAHERATQISDRILLGLMSAALMSNELPRTTIFRLEEEAASALAALDTATVIRDPNALLIALDLLDELSEARAYSAQLKGWPVEPGPLDRLEEMLRRRAIDERPSSAWRAERREGARRFSEWLRRRPPISLP